MNQCKECGKPGVLKSEPTRHVMSPNSMNFGVSSEDKKYYDWYCSPECKKVNQELVYALWAEIDENVSDSECFLHERWENGKRIGKCSISGEIVEVYPLMPSESSGQSSECTKHFQLKNKYQEIIDIYSLKNKK